jgi:hypothetical protein
MSQSHRSGHRDFRQQANAPSPATIDVNRFPATIQLLNSLVVWQNRIAFSKVRRKGPMIVATTVNGIEIVWPSTAELSRFAASQALIADATNILIPTPKKGEITRQWEQAVLLLLKLSAKAEDSIRLQSPLREETADWLRLFWKSAEMPTATSNAEFIAFMREIQTTKRNPRWGMDDPHAAAKPPWKNQDPLPPLKLPPCVFVAEGFVWTHTPTLRVWLSIPALINRMPTLTDLRNGLLLLDFAYYENVTRRDDGDDRESLCLWKGPLSVLMDSPEVELDSTK